MHETADVLKEGFTCRQCGADKPISVIAESEKAVEKESQDVESCQ